MKNLKDAVPVDLLKGAFPTLREEVIATSIKELKASKREQITEISMFVWDEMVHRDVAKQPFKIAPIINKDFKGVYEFVQKELKAPPVSEVYAASYFNEVDPDMSFADVTLVQCYPDDIHIVDVEFSDNRRPLGKKSPVKGMRNYHGLHVFGDFIARLKDVARARGVSRISLMVADKLLYPVFKRHGFEVSDTFMAQQAFHGAGVGFPMILRVV